MGVEVELAEWTFKIPRTGLAVLAVIVGVIIILAPAVLGWLVGIFMVAWGILEWVQMSNRPGTGKWSSS